MQIVRSFACAAALAGASLVCSVSAGSASVNLLTNGGFETGDFSGWTIGGNFSYMSVTSGGYGAENGVYSVYFGPVGSDATLSQTLTTTPGATYLLSGWLAGNGSGYSEWGFSWDGATEVFVSPVPSQGYVQYTATVTGTGTDTFTTFFRNDPSFDGADITP
jgi:hypothetical protein